MVTPPLLFCGIDPGKSGALCIVGDDLAQALMMDMPLGADGYVDAPSLVAALRVFDGRARLVAAALGEPTAFHSAYPAMLALGQSHGLAMAALQVAGVPSIIHAPPCAWKRALRLSADKSGSLAIAETLIKGLSLRRPGKRRGTLLKASHDGAEAALLAAYARAALITPLGKRARRPVVALISVQRACRGHGSATSAVAGIAKRVRSGAHPRHAIAILRVGAVIHPHP